MTSIPLDGLLPDHYEGDRAGEASIVDELPLGKRAALVVAETPHVVIADPNGSFTFEGVQPGAYTLSVYSGGSRRDQPIQVANGRNDVQITMN